MNLKRLSSPLQDKGTWMVFNYWLLRVLIVLTCKEKVNTELLVEMESLLLPQLHNMDILMLWSTSFGVVLLLIRLTTLDRLHSSMLFLQEILILYNSLLNLAQTSIIKITTSGIQHYLLQCKKVMKILYSYFFNVGQTLIFRTGRNVHRSGMLL